MRTTFANLSVFFFSCKLGTFNVNFYNETQNRRIKSRVVLIVFDGTVPVPVGEKSFVCANH